MKESEFTVSAPTTKVSKVFKIDTIQPNSVTTARYDFSKAQEDILTLMISAVQEHMSKSRNIQTDLFGTPQITINVNEMGQGNNKLYYWKQALGMIDKHFAFDYTPKNGKETKVAGVFITTALTQKGSSEITLIN